MPLRGSNKTEYQRNYMRDKRKQKGVTSEGVTAEGEPHYLTLSDGQVLDRANQPEPNKHIPEMIACNRANETDLSRGRSKARRVAMIGMALDKSMTGLDGKRLVLSSLVRYGIGGYTFSEIKELLA